MYKAQPIPKRHVNQFDYIGITLVTVTSVHLKLILTFGVKLNGMTVRPAEAPRTVEDGSALFNVDLPRFGLGSSDHHTGTADRAKKRGVVNLPLYINPTTGY